jgi:hypothetical protein
MTGRELGLSLRAGARLARCAAAIALCLAARPGPAVASSEGSALPAPCAFSIAVPDTTASPGGVMGGDTARVDTTRADTSRAGGERPGTAGAAAAPARPDTVAPGEPGGVWKMDELKEVLGSETAGLEPGGKYRERRNGRVAMACALLVPGLGQIYNERPIKAAIVVGLESYYLGQIFINRRLWEREKFKRDVFPVNSNQWINRDLYAKEYFERSVDWVWWSSALLLAVVIDAYVDAHLSDMRFRVGPRVTPTGAGVALIVPY